MHDFFNIGRRALKFDTYIENKKILFVFGHIQFSSEKMSYSKKTEFEGGGNQNRGFVI